jgi:hypothetical protein
MSLITLVVKVLLAVGLVTMPPTLQEISQLPVIYQGRLEVNGIVHPTVVHYDAKTLTHYIVVIKVGRIGIEPLFVYKLSANSLELEQIWHDPATEA